MMLGAVKIGEMGEGLNRPTKGAYKLSGLGEDMKWPKANEMECEGKKQSWMGQNRLDGGWKEK
jgi:hypothetical protein